MEFARKHGVVARIALGAAVLVMTSAAWAATEAPTRSTGITILDDRFQVIHVLNGRKAVAAFNAYWSNKQKVARSNLILHLQYKIDMKDGTRWLYDPAGYAQLVSQKSTPLYRIRSVNQFNKLIGISKRPPREGAGP
ncbi:MAG TPA: hypothetical protein VK654_02350 [Nitrospirota bacterium]|nr:hypothetical protein [Nitrospirota bacterium]